MPCQNFINFMPSDAFWCRMETTVKNKECLKIKISNSKGLAIARIFLQVLTLHNLKLFLFVQRMRNQV